MKSIKWIILSILSVTIAGFAYSKYSSDTSEHVHYHAGFVVYIDGVKQDYSDYKYMNFVPCTEHNTKKSKTEEQIELAHLHDGVGDVVHVHRPGAKWGDLFKNIGVELGQGVPELDQSIAPDSSIVISIGKPVDNPEKVSLEHIKEVEAKSELCGSN